VPGLFCTWPMNCDDGVGASEPQPCAGAVAKEMHCSSVSGEVRGRHGNNLVAWTRAKRIAHTYES
jgi:hypothetical protein